MKLYEFYKRFEQTPHRERFVAVEFTPEKTSMFEIFQQLTHVRAQQRYYEKMEEELLRRAEEVVTKIHNGK